MAIINGTRFSKKTSLKLNVNSDLLEQVKNYCQWAGIEDTSYFFEEAAYYVLSKDKDWVKKNKTSKRGRKPKVAE